MVDRSNAEDIFKILKEDFNWIKEDIQQHLSVLQEEMIDVIKQGRMNEIDEYKEKHQDSNKIIEKLDEIKNEYISIIKGEEPVQVEDELEYAYLEDWTGSEPREILLFDQVFEVKYWQDILLIIMEELYKMDKNIVDEIANNKDFKERTRLPFTFKHSKINRKYYKKTSYGLYALINDNANTIYSRCIKVLDFAGFNEDELKIKISGNLTKEYNQNINIERDNHDEIIKLSRKYASVSFNKSLFKVLVNSIINRKEEYGTNYIEPRKIADKYEGLILRETKYTTPYHVVINIIKYLIDIHFLDNYRGTKKGKYIVVDNNSLSTWLEKNI